MLRVDAVTYQIKGHALVKDISFTVRPGEVLALLGANGAGKSTLISMLCGERTPGNGHIHFCGKPLASYKSEEIARKRATLSQHNVVNMPFPAADIVMMGRYPHYRNRPATRDFEVAEEAMAISGVLHLKDRSYLSLSGGEQQRVQLARILSQVWDSPGALLLLDEPIAAMDAFYQQQTLAIVKAFAQKGFMVVAALHEINLAAQYADRILMMKNGRRWRDGTPSEVLTPLNIYTVFSIETEVVINPRTLHPYILPKEIKLKTDHFNSKLSPEKKPLTLKEKYEAYKELHPHKQLAEIAFDLGVSEAALLMTQLGQGVTLLRPQAQDILQCLPSLGYITAITGSPCCQHERKSIYPSQADKTAHPAFVGEGIFLHPNLVKWSIILATDQTEDEYNSIQFFNTAGCALHKVYLTEKSDLRAYGELINKFKASVQTGMAIEFSEQKHHTAQRQALRLAPENRVKEITIQHFKNLMATCSANSVPVMVAAGNEGCLQVHTGSIRNLVGMGAWYHVTDTEFSLQLKESAVTSAWHVIKPTAQGEINSIELFDKQGQPILQVSGTMEDDMPEPEAWREAIHAAIP
jgi:ABC-type hemin transport system ATPase subunit/putative heme degradation protein